MRDDKNEVREKIAPFDLGPNKMVREALGTPQLQNHHRTGRAQSSELITMFLFGPKSMCISIETHT